MVHPTQKPLKLIRWFLRTYTNRGDAVLNNCIGSGSTAVACIEMNRHFIGYEKDEQFFVIAEKRIQLMQKEIVV